jgi:chemotaxis protein CheC
MNDINVSETTASDGEPGATLAQRTVVSGAVRSAPIMAAAAIPETALLTEEERDTLQEMMNIAFGRAAASLAELISIFVCLSVPCVQLLRGAELTHYLDQVVGPKGEVNIVEENFWGELQGSAFLVFPSGAGHQLVPLFADEESLYEGEAREDVERDALLTTGSILIGACVGKLAELLGSRVSYSPAKLMTTGQSEKGHVALWEPDSIAIVLKTDFAFCDESVEGFLFLVTSAASINWLKQALADFLAQYEG